MAKQNVNDKEAIRQENLQETVSKTDQFYNENKKTIWTVACIIVVVALAVFAYVKLIYQPKCAEAVQQAFPAEQSFAAGEFELALNGDGNVLGLADVIAEYGSKAGAAVYMEAGVCALQLGQYEDALAYLKKYNGKEPILAARALACQGDAYVGLEKYNEAAAAYGKAAAKALNGDEYEFPMFVVSMDLDTDPQYGCTLTAHWNYNTQQGSVAGNTLYPTQVYEQYAMQGQYGDYQLVSDADFDPNYQFDGTAHAFSGHIVISFYQYEDFQAYCEAQGIAQPTIADVQASGTMKDLDLTLNNYTFQAASK